MLRYTLVSILLMSIANVLYSKPQPMLYNEEAWVPIPDNSFKNYTQAIDSQSWMRTDATIFIGLVSFRDRRCGLTLKNIFTKAKYPDRIRVGIVEAKHTEEDKLDCVLDYCQLMKDQGLECLHKDHIRYVEHSWLDSRGPGRERSMLTDLLKSEEFCLQLDSHSDTVQNWDIKTSEMWGSIGNEYAILSTRLPDVSSLPKVGSTDQSTEVPHLCQATFTSSGMVRALQPRIARGLNSPLLAPLWSAGFSFSKCHAMRKVPYDPNLQYIYDGEEFSMFARFWTHGYDVYSPTEILFGHDYVDKMAKILPPNLGAPRKENGQTYTIDVTEWSRNGMNAETKRRLYDDSIARIKMLLKGPDMPADNVAVYAEMLGTLSRYGLGMKRTLDQFIQFTGIDVRGNAVFGDRCKALSWVPFVADKDPNTDETDVWGNAPEILYQGGRNIPIIGNEVNIVPFPKSVTDALSEVISTDDAEAEKNLRTGNFHRSVEEMSQDSWFSFNAIDDMIQYTIMSLDKEFGVGRGYQVLKVVLLGAPVVFGVLAGAIWVLKGDERAESYAKNI